MFEEKETSEIIDLNSREYKLFNFLKSSSFDNTKITSGPTIDDIRKHLKIGVEEARLVLNSLKRHQDVQIFSNTERGSGKKQVHYFLSPESLEVSIHRNQTKKELEQIQKKDKVYGALYLAEPGFGTKAFDHDYTMRGLRLFLEANGLTKDIKQVVFQGGVIPHVPPYSSKANLTALKFLGHIKRKPGEELTVSEQLLEEKIIEMDNPYLNDFYGKHVNNSERRKIRDLDDAFNVAEEQVQILMSAFPEDTVLRIQHGEEDKKNLDHIVDAITSNWSGAKKARIESDKKIFESNLDNLISAAVSTKLELEFHRTVKRPEDICERKPGQEIIDYEDQIRFAVGKKVKENLNTILPTLPSDLQLSRNRYEFIVESVSNARANFLVWGRNHVESAKNSLTKIIQRLEEKDKQFYTKRDELQGKIRALEGTLTWTQKLLEDNRATITRFTRQYPVQADESEVAWNISKNIYTANFHNWDISQNNIHIHVSPRKLVTVDTGIIEDINSGDTLKSQVELESMQYGKKKILMIHNVRNVFSDAVSPKSISETKLDLNFQNIVLKKLIASRAKDERPDIVLLGGHNAGGFRAMPWFKDHEEIGGEKFIEGQKMAYMVNLPTMQSIEKLEWLVAHNFSNWDTKRFQTGPYASGAVIHTEDKEAVNRFLYVDNEELIKFGKLAEQIQVYRSNLRSAKSKDERGKLLKLIKDRKEEVKINFKKIEAAGDFHLGSPDAPYRYSKDQFIRAYQSYQYQHGLPDMVEWDEVLHGTMSKTFNSASRYLGEVPEKLRQNVIEPILNDRSMSDKDKTYQIAAKCLENLRAITIHNDADQERLFRLLFRPYAEDLLRKGKKIILCSGNHTNNSRPTSDEACALANQFSEDLRDSKQLMVFSGKGNPVGAGYSALGTAPLEKDRKVFVMHKFPVRHDEGYGVLCHMRKMNNDADIVLAGDRHQPIIFYGDGHAGAVHPGMETINSYVPFVGMPAGVRGIINVQYDTRNRGVYGWEMILNPTLERYVKKEKIM